MTSFIPVELLGYVHSQVHFQVENGASACCGRQNMHSSYQATSNRLGIGVATGLINLPYGCEAGKLDITNIATITSSGSFHIIS